MSAKVAPFNSQELLSRLLTLPRVKRYLVGFSGGADSTALLTALHSIRGDLDASCEAVHFNHGLHPKSDAWERHCAKFCDERDIRLTCHRLDLTREQSNLEGRARGLRYRKLEEMVGLNTLFLTGHNLDDRSETFLLHALRGSGLEGLASIPAVRTLGRGLVARPLLDFSREALREYLEKEDVPWVEDPSNLDTSFDRNFIRQEVLPLLESRWPAARQTLARASGHLESASQVLAALITERTGPGALDGPSLSLETLNCLGSAASGLILREWLHRQGVTPPPEARVRELLDQLSRTSPGSHCAIDWDKRSLKQFRNELRLETSEPYPECPVRNWDATSALRLGRGLGVLGIEGGNFPVREHWIVGPRQPGKRLQLHPEGPARKLKKLFQEQAIPKWQRMSIPVLYSGDRTLAIGDWLYDSEFAAWLGEHSLAYRWRPAIQTLLETRAKCHKDLGHDAIA
jgi:tRNA(Ile)-lysidine synthase